MFRMRSTRVRTGDHARQAQALHQALHPFPVDHPAPLPQKWDHPPTAKEWMARVFFIQEPEQQRLFLVSQARVLMTVIGRTTDPRQGALPQ